MPNRILREGILTSVAVNSLTPQAEVFYRRLMSIVDDFGRFDGLAPVIFGRLYALQIDRVRVADVERWIAECEKAGLVRTYTVAGKPYLTLKNLGEPRATKSKYPEPTKDIREWQGLDESICARLRANVPDSYSGSSAPTGASSCARALTPGKMRAGEKSVGDIVAERLNREKAKRAKR